MMKTTSLKKMRILEMKKKTVKKKALMRTKMTTRRKNSDHEYITFRALILLTVFYP